MKQLKLFIFTIVVAFVCSINVNAAEPFLVPVSSSLTPQQGAINTFEHYTYDVNQIYRQGEDLYFYSNVKNNTEKPRAICVEALLFDKDEKNIGVFNYSSLKDYETQFASKKLNSGEIVSFNYKIINKYLADSEKTTLSDVASYAIISDNEYCKIGGYDKYEGKTFNEIVGDIGTVKSGTKFDALISQINKYVPIDGLNVGLGVGVIVAIVVFIIVIAIWIAYGSFLNKLHNAMYNKTTALAYVPIANSYLTVKMAFGKIVGLSYLGVSLLGGLLTLVGFGFIVAIANLALIVAFVLDIVKLVTGKYDLCYLDNANNNVIVNNYNQNNNVNNNINNNFNNTVSEFDNQNNQIDRNQTNEYGYSQDNNVKESLLGVSTDKALDEDNTNNNDNVNIGGNNTNNNQNNNDDSEQSDLSRFFR